MMFKKSFVFVFLLVCSGLVVGQNEEDQISASDNDTTTTTSTTTTTTAATTTTTAAPVPVPTPAPAGHYYYNVTSSKDNKTLCIMMAGDISFNIVYASLPNGTNTTDVMLPKPSADVRVLGDCGEKEQHMEVSWGPTSQAHQVKLTFALSEDNKSWNITSLHANIPIDQQFKNASDEGKTIMLNTTLAMTPHSVPVSQSFKCIAMEGGNYTAFLDTPAQDYTHRITVNFRDIQIQAFNQVADAKQFAAEIHCDADKTSDLVPIAVGCALGALVVIVLVAYVFGRRRRSAAYQSV